MAVKIAADFILPTAYKLEDRERKSQILILEKLENRWVPNSGWRGNFYDLSYLSSGSFSPGDIFIWAKMKDYEVKYRRLTMDELAALEQEFVEFLVVNGITAPDWEKLKVTDTEKVDHMIGLFSDVVFSSVMRKTRFLSYITPKKLMCFACGDELIELLYLKTDDPSIDLSTMPLSPEVLSNCTLAAQSKPYSDTRELEIFKMTQQGCLADDGVLYQQLAGLTNDKL